MRVHFFVPRAHHAELAGLALANVRFGFLPSEQLQNALCAFDYGLLMRRAEGLANSFAFPLKASEYANARLGILLDTGKSKNAGNDADNNAVNNTGDGNDIRLGWTEGSLSRSCVSLADFPLKDLTNVRLSYRDLQKLEFAYMVKDLVRQYEVLQKQ